MRQTERDNKLIQILTKDYTFQNILYFTGAAHTKKWTNKSLKNN